MLTSSAVNTECANPFWSGLRAPASALTGRFFIWAGLVLCVVLAPGQNSAAATKPDQAECLTRNYDETATVKRVIDGDTVILADDRHIRLIGINTPEISHDDRASQPGAYQAYNYLNSLLHTQKTVNLHYDQERTDHYGRTLAHLFLQDGTNIQSLLLTRGLATTLTIPPNLEFIDCYATSAGYAQSRMIGLWALKQYQPTPAAFITRRDLGYHIITGNITHVGKSKSSLWINLAQNLSLRIATEDLHYFGTLGELTGKQIRASGLLYFSNGEFRMQIRHPVDLKIINAGNGN